MLFLKLKIYYRIYFFINKRYSLIRAMLFKKNALFFGVLFLIFYEEKRRSKSKLIYLFLAFMQLHISYDDLLSELYLLTTVLVSLYSSSWVIYFLNWKFFIHKQKQVVFFVERESYSMLASRSFFLFLMHFVSQGFSEDLIG